MAITSLHSHHLTRLYSADLSNEVLLDGVSTQAINLDNTFTREPTSGSVYSRFVAISAQLFNIPLSTFQLKLWLDQIGLIGKKITNDVGPPIKSGIEVFAQLYDEGNAGRAAGSLHRKYTVGRGYVAPRTLTANQGEDASLDYEIFAIAEGANAPVAIADNQALPALSGDGERFTLGPVELGGKDLTAVRSMEIDFALDVTSEAADGDVWASFISVASIQPTITLRGVDINWWEGTGAVNTQGLACTHANTVFYLRKRKEGGTFFVDNATAEHIKLTAAGVAAVSTGQTGTPNEVEITLPCKFDGTNVPIVINTASAIT